MYFIEKEEGLKGKEIIFTHFPQFANEMIIVTKDKGIFMFDKSDEEVEIYRKHNARNCLFKNEYIRGELNKLNIITNEEIIEYKKQIEEEWKKQLELRKKKDEENEYNQYLKLKEKYENNIKKEVL